MYGVFVSCSRAILLSFIMLYESINTMEVLVGMLIWRNFRQETDRHDGQACIR